jgi:hypothetical protein
MSNDIRKSLHTQHFSYNTEEYPFKDLVEEILGVRLEELHKFLGQYNVFNRASDQSTLAHKVFYANFESKIKPLYNSFISDIIANIVQTDFYYQVIPTFRIGLPGNKFVGEFHTDTKYNHQPYEVNFNLGLANYTGNAALLSEKTPESSEFVLLECPYGEIFSFDHIDCLHGSEPNGSELTMASFDFRLAIKDLYVDTPAKSINVGTSFKPGSYFSAESVPSTVGGDQGD